MTDRQAAEARDERVRDLVSVHDDVTLAGMYVDASVRLAQAERMAECDCVPCVVSSKSCRKCGRKATIPQEQMVRGVNDLEARLAQAERQRDLLDALHDVSEWESRAVEAEVRLREYEEAASDALGRLDMLADGVREHRCEACTDDVAEARAALSRVAASGGREAP